MTNNRSNIAAQNRVKETNRKEMKEERRREFLFKLLRETPLSLVTILPVILHVIIIIFNQDLVLLYRFVYFPTRGLIKPYVSFNIKKNYYTVFIIITREIMINNIIMTRHTVLV